MALSLKTDPEQKTWEEYKLDIQKLKDANKAMSESDAIAFARTFCYAVTKYLWKYTDYREKWECRPVKFNKTQFNFETQKLSREIAEYFVSLNIMEYAHLLGNLYTMLLPDSYRSDNGVYYTPPALAERLLDLLTAEGADWIQAEILDPACGGGAFLITVANRILGDYRIKAFSSEEKIRHLETHLAGFELDAFAGWLTQTLLDILVYSESVEMGRRLKPVVKIEDTIQHALKESRRFDVILGNPPYGKIQLGDTLRKDYARCLYGHANLYGLFIDAALRLNIRDGLIGFVTPTSFLGGKYFSNLRKLLSEMAPPLAIDFISMRTGVFDQVLQETCLAVFGKNNTKTVTTNKISVEKDVYNVERLGSFPIETGVNPWIIAREPEEAELLNRANAMKNTLEDYGYKVFTGQLVWNRLKKQICQGKIQQGKPIIWAEAILPDGEFSFDYKSRKDKKYIKIGDAQDFLVCKEPVVLVQRTTSKEQQRRLQSCVLPESFIKEWNGVVVENHVNIIRPISETPQISLQALCLLLNCKTVDRFFRCLSGSVAVSASELHAIPLPPADKLNKLEELAGSWKNRKINAEKIEQVIMSAYGLEEANIEL